LDLAHTAYPTHELSPLSGFLEVAPAHTAYPAHYLRSLSGFLEKVSAHTAYPTHYLSFLSGFLEKVLQTKSTLKLPDFFSIFSRFFLGHFPVRGVQKHDLKNIEKTNLTLVLFRTLTHPPTTGVTGFCLPAP
jgi:hypothetical protein